MVMKKIIITLNVLASIACVLLASKYIVYPKYMKISYGEEYKAAMFSCDNVMREHLLAKHRVIADTNAQTVNQLETSELGLVSCHHYDKLRKKLLNSGITERELAYLGLEKIEEHANDIHEIVETHEFRY